MSFRRRLTAFFLVIVIIPMAAMGVVVFVLLEDNEAGKQDARVGAFESSAINLYDSAREQARGAARAVAADPPLVRALRRDDLAAARRRAAGLVRRRGLARLHARTSDGGAVDVGARDAIASQQARIVERGGREVGGVTVSTLRAGDFVRDLGSPGIGVVVRRGGRTLTATSPPGGVAAPLPSHGQVSIRGRSYRVASFQASDPLGAPVAVSVLYHARGSSNSGARRLAGALLLAFFGLAFTFALLVSRGLQSQIQGFLVAARRIAGGDFATRVPIHGRDEFAALGDEFNKMSEQLEDQVRELRQERARLRRSIGRIGQTFASNLNREALLELGIQTVVDAVAAGFGQATWSEGEELVQRTVVGSLDGNLELIESAEREARATGEVRQASGRGASALALALGSGAEGGSTGMFSVARRGAPFTADERELFGSLANQAAVSIENAELHMRVRRQALTDELTGLLNHRAFHMTMDNLIGEARRFQRQVGLVMIDLDNFKSINDTHGHPQGDEVLRAVARVLRETSRENVDRPARYGGEELAVGLPETGLEGAHQLAERMRRAIEGLEVPLLDGTGSLRVTASLGVAASATASKQDLIDAADRALYQAKHSGKNRTIRGTLEA